MKFLLGSWMILICLSLTQVKAGDENADGSKSESLKDRKVLIKKASGKIILDGKLDEEAWENAEIAQCFIQNFPTDTSMAVSPSEIRLTYDENFIYVSAICRDFQHGEYTIGSLRRDFRGSENDGISIIFDPFKDQTMGFFFGLSPFGVSREGIISPGGDPDEPDTDYSWDNKWYHVAKVYDGYWIGEMAIPFSTLRFNAGSDSWKANFYRIDTKQNERTSWYPIPRGFRLSSLAFTGELIWDKPLEKKEGPNISLIPYVGGGYSQDFLEAGEPEANINIGGDVKIGVTPSLNLDLTFNPDFSQVEVDEQVTNLTRFELFFPERRQFFIENSDLFANYGSETIRPFFSRRIGLVYDSAIGQNRNNRIIYGARLSGKLNKNWRTGILNVQTAKEEDIGKPGQNYSMFALQRRLSGGSNIGAFFINKQAFSFGEDTNSSGQHNRVAGVDYNLNSADGHWMGKFFYHQVFAPRLDDQTFATGGVLEYRTSTIRLGWLHQWVGENFEPEVGFVPRNNFKRLRPNGRYLFYPARGIINRHGPGFETDFYWNNEGTLTDRILSLKYNIFFQNTGQMEFSLDRNYILLRRNFRIGDGDTNTLLAGSDFQYTNLTMEYQSDKRNPLYYTFEATAGGFFNGQRFGISGDLNLRWQPKGIFSLIASYNKIIMPENFEDAELVLIGPRLDLTFTRSLFFTAFTQYNSQIDNININSRLQWRFKPVSDLFLVYTENYFPMDLKSKNRAILAKISYWLNI